MKKNKIIFSTLILALIIGTLGCTATRSRTPINQRTQDRIGLDAPNDNLTRQRNLNMMGMDRRNTNNITNKNPNGLNTPNNGIRRNSGVGPNTATDLTRRNTMDTNTLWHRSNIIAKKVVGLKEVNDCSVLLSGNTAIVGVDIKKDIQGNLTNDLKNRITQAVKDADGSIKNVSITADPDLFTRISNIGTDIRDGRPISGFAEEFQEILRRINPLR